MRTFVILAVLIMSVAPAMAQEEPLPPLPSQEDPIPYKEWTDYADTLLRTVYPEHGEFIDRIEYAVLDLADPMIATIDRDEKQEFQLSIGLIRAFTTPEEFAVQLGHELAHMVKGHPSRVSVDFRHILYGPDPTAIFVIVAEEIEADLFAALPLKDGMCAVHRNNERSARLMPEPEKLPERYRLQHTQRRQLFKGLCEYLKEQSPAQ